MPLIAKRCLARKTFCINKVLQSAIEKCKGFNTENATDENDTVMQTTYAMNGRKRESRLFSLSWSFLFSALDSSFLLLWHMPFALVSFSSLTFSVLKPIILFYIHYQFRLVLHLSGFWYRFLLWRLAFAVACVVFVAVFFALKFSFFHSLTSFSRSFLFLFLYSSFPCFHCLMLVYPRCNANDMIMYGSCRLLRTLCKANRWML